MRSKTFTVTGVLGTVAALALVTGCSTTPAKLDVSTLFSNWNAALATGDADKVADLYAPDAVLLPTVSDKVRTNRADIVDYFKHFLENKPSGTIENEVVNVLDEDTAVNTGVYRFALATDGKTQEVRARYTFVYELRDGKWLIVNHHSSAMPGKA
ncbi:SgcJ/EcaC family oxidoreductase [Amycolatopsis sp. NPDC059657]|uniref:SgcJ/EcaC family oxidoreductase n=1 Tax=Amycolatopsis sp. NPDC059657 TaxID=3346899 RepID=UPI0036724F0B